MLSALAALARVALPYVAAPELRVGAIHLHPFGVLVSAGLLAGAWVASARARKFGLDPWRFSTVALFTVAAGLAGAHVVEILADDGPALALRPWDLLLVHHGLSSFGGFLGAALAFFAYARGRLPLLRTADALACGVAVGWLFGRAGCALVHDHPGVLSSAALAVAFPDGSRFDLGLLELAATPLLVAATFLAPRTWPRPGASVVALCVAYALVRFPLEFLRAPAQEGGDARWLGLTPGQYGALLLLAAGAAVAMRARRPHRRRATPAPLLPPARHGAGR